MSRFFPFKCLLINLILIFYIQALVSANTKKTDAIATLINLEGTVKVITKQSKKGEHAREGMLLFNENKIHTSLNSKTSILYRDGSRIRLFQNSKLIMNFSEEKFSAKRNFNYHLTLNGGSVRGRFKKGRQSTKIRTPTAIIGIKGTSFRISEKNYKSTVSLTEGQLEVSNLKTKVIINTGQWLNNFNPNTNLTKLVSSLPNILSLKTNVYEIDFEDEESKQIELSLQIQNTISEKSIKRSGFVVFDSNYKKINLPERIFLNERGFAKILVGINPPNLNNQEFIGLIKIRAYLDEEGFDDVADGLLVLKIKDFGKKRTILLHPDMGVVEKK